MHWNIHTIETKNQTEKKKWRGKKNRKHWCVTFSLKKCIDKNMKFTHHDSHDFKPLTITIAFCYWYTKSYHSTFLFLNEWRAKKNGMEKKEKKKIRQQKHSTFAWLLILEHYSPLNRSQYSVSVQRKKKPIQPFTLFPHGKMLLSLFHSNGTMRWRHQFPKSPLIPFA